MAKLIRLVAMARPAFIGSFNPGDEVVLFEPTYDAYPVGCALSGAVPRYVTLHSPDWSIDAAELRAAFSARTAAIPSKPIPERPR